jgi:hypothetical protein
MFSSLSVPHKVHTVQLRVACWPVSVLTSEQDLPGKPELLKIPVNELRVLCLSSSKVHRAEAQSMWFNHKALLVLG